MATLLQRLTTAFQAVGTEVKAVKSGKLDKVGGTITGALTIGTAAAGINVAAGGLFSSTMSAASYARAAVIRNLAITGQDQGTHIEAQLASDGNPVKAGHIGFKALQAYNSASTRLTQFDVAGTNAAGAVVTLLRLDALNGSVFAFPISSSSGYVAQYVPGRDIRNRIESGFWQTDQTAAALGWPVDGLNHHLISTTHEAKGANYSLQITAPFFGNDDIWYRSTSNTGSQPWNKFWHSGNLQKAYFNARELGLKGDGVTDDTAAFQAIPGKVPYGALVYFPAGTYPVTAGMGISGKSLTFLGAGLGSTTIKLTGTNQVLFNSAMTDVLQDFQVMDMALMSAGIGNYAFNVSKPGLSIFQGPIFERLKFIGADPNNQGWQTCIQLSKCTHFRVVRCQCTGAQTNVQTFLKLGGPCTDGTCWDNRVSHADKGIWAESGSNCEGIQVGFNKFVGVGDGIWLDDGAGAPGGQIVYNHIASFRFGVRVNNRPQIQIVGNLLYKWSNGNYVGIQFENYCVACHVQGNHIIGFSTDYTGTAVGIVGGASNRCMLVHNTLEKVYTGIDLTASCSGFDDSNQFIAVGTPVNSPGPNHQVGRRITWSGV